MAERTKNNTLISWIFTGLSFLSGGNASGNISPQHTDVDTHNPVENTIKNSPNQKSDSISLSVSQQADSLKKSHVSTIEDIKTALAHNSSIFQKNITEMKQKGRFFVSVTNTNDIIYLTNKQIKELNIDTEAHITDNSAARETGISPQSSDDKKTEALFKVSGFFGPFQYNENNMKNMVLWGLCQKDSLCQEFSRRCIAAKLNFDKEKTQAFINAYNEKHKDILAGKVNLTETLSINGAPFTPKAEAVKRFIISYEKAMQQYANALQQIDQGSATPKTYNTKKF